MLLLINIKDKGKIILVKKKILFICVLLSATLILSMQCAGTVNIDGAYKGTLTYKVGSNIEELPVQFVFKRGGDNTFTGTFALKIPKTQTPIRLASMRKGKIMTFGWGGETFLVFSMMTHIEPIDVDATLKESTDAQSFVEDKIVDPMLLYLEKERPSEAKRLQRASTVQAFDIVMREYVMAFFAGKEIRLKVLDNGAVLEDVNGKKFRKK